MHDIDRTQMEYNPETGFETEQLESDEYESDEYESDAFESDEFESDEYESDEYESDEVRSGDQEWGEVFGEDELMELAAELLEVRDEAELDQFLGALIFKKVRDALRRRRARRQGVQTPVGQAIGGILKGAAKKVVPAAGAALGGQVGGPLGAKIGSGLASMAGQALGLELEALSAEDREFEGAKQFVRFAGQTVKNATSARPTANPKAVAKTAATAAARKFAPGLLNRAAGVSRSPSTKNWVRGRTGRWVMYRSTKSGKKRIVLFGV